MSAEPRPIVKGTCSTSLRGLPLASTIESTASGGLPAAGKVEIAATAGATGVAIEGATGVGLVPATGILRRNRARIAGDISRITSGGSGSGL